MSNEEQAVAGHKIVPIKLVEPVEIEHLQAVSDNGRTVFNTEAAHQFHFASILLEEENARHTAETQRLNEIINTLRSHVAPGDRDLLPSDLDPTNPNRTTNPSNAARIRVLVQARRAAAATT